MPAQLIFATVVFGFLIIETLRASSNERAQRARGGREPAGDVYTIMRVVYPGAFLAMFLSGTTLCNISHTM